MFKRIFIRGAHVDQHNLVTVELVFNFLRRQRLEFHTAEFRLSFV